MTWRGVVGGATYCTDFWPVGLWVWLKLWVLIIRCESQCWCCGWGYWRLGSCQMWVVTVQTTMKLIILFIFVCSNLYEIWVRVPSVLSLDQQSLDHHEQSIRSRPLSHILLAPVKTYHQGDQINPLHPRTILANSGFWEGTCASMLFWVK
jgi:hypothetical protein